MSRQRLSSFQQSSQRQESWLGHRSQQATEQEEMRSTHPAQPKTFHESRFHYDFSHIPVSSSDRPLIQPKLTIGAAGDRYEQEADRIASQVVNQMNAPQQGATVQRQAEKEDDEDTLQMKSLSQNSFNSAVATPELEAGIGRSRNGGHPLAANIRKPMEQALGADFSRVRVHTDAQADRLNHLAKARAFTTGKDIFFRQNAYNPVSQSGQKLIAHELTHVVQQAKTLPENQEERKDTRVYSNSADTVMSSNGQRATPLGAVFLQRSVFEYPDEDKQFETSSTTLATLGAGSDVKVDCDQDLPTAYGVLAKVYGTDALDADAFTFTQYGITSTWTRPRSIEAKMIKKTVEERKSPPFVSGVGHLGDTELAIRTGMTVQKESTLSYAGGHLIGDQILGSEGNAGFNLAPQETVNNRNPYNNTIEAALREAQSGTQYTYTVALKYESDNYEVDQGQLFTHGVLTQIQPDKPWKTQIPSRIPNSWTATAVLAGGQDVTKQFKTVTIPTEKTLTEIGEQYYGTPFFSDAPLGSETKRVWSAYKFRAHTLTGVKKEGDSAGATQLEFHMRQHVPQDKNKRNPAEGERTTGLEATAFGGVSAEAALTLEALQARLRAVNNYAKGFKEKLNDSITQKLDEYLALRTADEYATEIKDNIERTNSDKISRAKVMKEILSSSSMEDDSISDSDYVNMMSKLTDDLKTHWANWSDIDVTNQDYLKQANLSISDITDQLELAEKGLLELEETSKATNSSIVDIANEESPGMPPSEELLDVLEESVTSELGESLSTPKGGELNSLGLGLDQPMEDVLSLASVETQLDAPETPGEALSTDVEDDSKGILDLDPIVDVKAPSLTALEIKQILDQVFSLIGNLDMEAAQLMKRWDATKAEIDDIDTKSVERKSGRVRKIPQKESDESVTKTFKSKATTTKRKVKAKVGGEKKKI